MKHAAPRGDCSVFGCTGTEAFSTQHRRQPERNARNAVGPARNDTPLDPVLRLLGKHG